MISQSDDEIGQFSQRDSFGRNDIASITGLIIAAGLSSRMKEFKPLLTYQNKSFLLNIVSKLSSVCDEIVVVTGHNRESIETELNSFPNIKKIKTVFNKNYQDGMFTSLQTGLEHIGNHNWVLYHFIDQPTLPILLYENFANQIDKSFEWIQPKYKGKNGHPIIMGKNIIDLIIAAPKNSNLKELTTNPNIAKKYWECNYPEIHDDIDTIERYNNLTE